MSLLDRRTVLLMPLAVAACGFQPVYGPAGAGTALRDRVRVDDPDDNDGYVLTREIETALGRSTTPAYGLALTVATTEDGLAIDSEGDIDRYNILGTVAYALRDLATGRIITSGQVENFTGYSATGTTVATLASRQDAQERLMVLLAQQVVTRLYAADLAQ